MSNTEKVEQWRVRNDRKGLCITCGKEPQHGESAFCFRHWRMSIEAGRRAAEKRRGGRPPKFRVKCRRCGGAGHYAKTCLEAST